MTTGIWTHLIKGLLEALPLLERIIVTAERSEFLIVLERLPELDTRSRGVEASVVLEGRLRSGKERENRCVRESKLVPDSIFRRRGQVLLNGLYSGQDSVGVLTLDDAAVEHGADSTDRVNERTDAYPLNGIFGKEAMFRVDVVDKVKQDQGLVDLD